MKTQGILFVLCTAALLLLSLYTGDLLCYIGFGILLSILVYAVLTCLWTLLDFHYLQDITPKEAPKGKHAVLTIQIHNDKPFLFPYLKVSYRTPESLLTDTKKEGILSVLPFHYGEIREEFPCSLRGIYPIGITGVEVMDLFGLFHFSMDLTRKHYHKMLRLTVLPRVLSLSNLPLPEIRQEGLLSNQLLKTNETAVQSDIRRYAYGDPLKKVHWKISSKMQDLYVMNYEMTTQPHVLLFLEMNLPDRISRLERRQLEDQMVESTTALAHYLLSKWIPLQFIIYQRSRQELSGRTPQNFPAFYEFLSGIAFQSPFSMSRILQIESSAFHSNESLILVVDQIGYDLFNRLCLLRQSGVRPMVFLIKNRNRENQEDEKMLQDLRKRAIPTFLIHTDQRLDEALEAMG